MRKVSEKLFECPTTGVRECDATQTDRPVNGNRELFSLTQIILKFIVSHTHQHQIY